MTKKSKLLAGAKAAGLVSASSVASGVLNAAILIVGARGGQQEEIAAYTVVVAILGVVSILFGGGSSLVYASGTEEERHAVRSLRALVVLPALAAATVITGFLYEPRGYGWTPILVSGAVMIGNNIAELQGGDFARQARFFEGALAGPVSKLAGLAAMLAGLPLTLALFVAVLVQFSINCLLLRSSTPVMRGLSFSAAVRSWRTGRSLLWYSLAEFYNGRIPTIALSVVVTPLAMGYFGAVLSTYQACSAVFYSTLQIPLSSRVRKRHGIDSDPTVARAVEWLSIVVVAGFAVVLFMVSPIIVGQVLTVPGSEPVWWLRIFAIALPFYLFNRTWAMRAIGDGDHHLALRAVTPISFALTVLLACLLPADHGLGAALSTLGAEAFGLVFIAAWWISSAKGRLRVDVSSDNRSFR